MEIPFNLLLSSKVEPTTVQATNRQRSEEHTSELQSQSNLVCRLLLEKKKQAYADQWLHYSRTFHHVVSTTVRYTHISQSLVHPCGHHNFHGRRHHYRVSHLSNYAAE